MATARGAAAETRAFWVWNREAPLTAPEVAALRAGGVTRLYWHVGELVARPGGALAWRSRLRLPAAPEGMEIVPTVRLATELRSPELFTAAALAEKLAAVAVGGKVQVDYDCPDRLVPLYAERLRAVRAVGGSLRSLSVTALAGWVDRPGFADLRDAADELCPMFYDLDPDPCAPLLEPADAARRLAAWGKACAGNKPWLAGLPAFARVTFVGPGGENQGHLRAWRWEELFLQAELRPGAARAGNLLMLADGPVRLGDRSVPAGQRLVVRRPEAGVVRAAVGVARASGASGVAFFRLPVPAEDRAADGPSLAATLGTLKAVEALAPLRLALRREPDGTLTLTNLSADLDLESWHGPLELEVVCGEGRPAWREALAGDFGAVATRGPVGLARRLGFRFARLPAGGSLRTGLVQLAPGVDPATLRWRLPQLPATDSWQPLEASFPSSSPSP